MTDLGNEYRGRANVTVTGIQCQIWGVNSPHNVDSNVYKILGLEEDHTIYATNYCRNPDDSPSGPWCYTTNPGVRWDYCNVWKC